MKTISKNNLKTNFEMMKTYEIIRIIVTLLLVCNVFHVTGYHDKEDGLIYILIWTRAAFEPFNFLEMGQKEFSKCAFKNCFLTGDHDYFKSILDFEVLMFNMIHLEVGMALPPERSTGQKYCMYGLDAAGYHSIPQYFNGYFNITFTYKLSSNITIPYVVVKDENDEIIGPALDMPWKKLSEMNNTSDYVKNKLEKKHIAAAWIVSHCETPWRRIYAQALQYELAQLGQTLDIFGKCGTKQCPKGGYGLCGTFMCPQYERMDECLAIIESDYYFYLSFENSFGEDYVTEKLLHALEHFTVPIVFGGANYNRFMPDGIYLNANILQPYQMADKIIEIINDKNKYYDFFKWHDHYSFHFSGEDRYRGEVCRLCAFLNNSMNKSSTIEFIAEWWNEEQPPWPTTQPDIGEQNEVEQVMTNLLDFLNPP